MTQDNNITLTPELSRVIGAFLLANTIFEIFMEGEYREVEVAAYGTKKGKHQSERTRNKERARAKKRFENVKVKHL